MHLKRLVVPVSMLLVMEITPAAALTVAQQEEAGLIEAIQAKGFTGGQVAEMRDLGILIFQSRFCGETHTPATYVEKIFRFNSMAKVYGENSGIYRSYGEEFASVLLKYADNSQRDYLCSLFPKASD